MSLDLETIYGLLPAVHRTRDALLAETLDGLLTPAEQAQRDALLQAVAEGGATEVQQRDLARLEEKRRRGPLKALLTIVAEQVAGLEENIAQLYDDQFIETCAPWAVPYIGDLIAHRPLDPELQALLGSTRAEVANTIGLRRRKGTAAVLEELAVGLTGWDAVAVEMFQRLATMQYLNHVRLDRPGTVNVRDVAGLADIAGPFDHQSHTADVRRIAWAPRQNIANVGIFLFRLGSLRLTDTPAAALDARRFRFDALGADVQLYTAAERSTDETRAAGPLDVTVPIGRRGLRDRLAQLYGPSLSLLVSVGGDPLELDEVEACDLSDVDGDWHHPGQEKVAIDPVLGRIRFPADVAGTVRVSYHYPALSELGGGEYDRVPTPAVAAALVRRVPADRATLTQALADVGGDGTVELDGSDAYAETPALTAGANAQLVVRAGNGSRPLLRLGGDLVVTGGDSGEVTLDGLLIAGGAIVVPELDAGGGPNRLQKLTLVHCTLVPGALPSLQVHAPNVTVVLERCIAGALRIAEGSTAEVAGGIVDALGATAVAYEAPAGGVGGPLALDACTTIGKLHAAELTVSGSILHAALAGGDAWPAPVIAERGQAGYVRFSYAPLDAQLPPRYRCRPAGATEAARIVPRFISLAYGRPGYCQLHDACPRELRCGADDGGELGVHHDVHAPQRVAATRVRLDEYLRFGLEAGLIFASQ